MARFLTLLGRASPRRPWYARLWSRLTGGRSPLRPRVVIVLDELDKLTASPDGMEALELILAPMKNLLSSGGAHYVFIGGTDLQDRWMQDVARGNSVFESVFSWHLYVACSWKAPEVLLDRLLVHEPDEGAKLRLLQYLKYKSRGLPRRLISEFNLLVRWNGTEPSIPASELNRLRLFAEMDSYLDELAAVTIEDEAEHRVRTLQKDRWRLGMYYAADRIVRSDGEPFDVLEILGCDATGFDPSLAISEKSVSHLVDHLCAKGFIEKVKRGDEERIVGDIPRSQSPRYQIVSQRRKQLEDIARADVQHRAELVAWKEGGAISAVAGGGLPASPAVPRVIKNRYELGNLIGQGGMGAVYQGRDIVLGTDVAIKMLNRLVANTPEARRRFVREGHIAATLVHRHIVRTMNVVDEDGVLAIVMEFVKGRELATVMHEGRMNARRAVVICLALVDAISYVHERGVVVWI
jgi:hypothetical protein